MVVYVIIRRDWLQIAWEGGEKLKKDPHYELGFRVDGVGFCSHGIDL